MDSSSSTRNGRASFFAVIAVLFVLISILIWPIFTGSAFLQTHNRTLTDWDYHFENNGWNAHLGLGQPEAQLPPGITGAFAELAKVTGDPAANFANYLPLVSLLFLGASAWYCIRQLNGNTWQCGIATIAATFSGVFFTTVMEHSIGIAVLGGVAFITFGVFLGAKIGWPKIVLTGLVLGIGIIETGVTVGIPIVVTTLILGILIAHTHNEKQGLDKQLLFKTAAIACLAGIITFASEIDNSQYNPPKAFALQPTDWATIPIGGFNGYRQDSLGGTAHHGTLSSGSAHIGMMTLLLSLWALVHAFRNNNTISSREKYLVKFLSTTTILSLAGTLWISQFIVITSVSFVLLCALGIKSFSNWIDSDEHAQSRSFGGGGFNSTWRMGFLGLLGLAALGFVGYGSMEQAHEVHQELEADRFAEKHWRLGVAVVSLFLSVTTLVALSFRQWSPPTRKWALSLIGIILCGDLLFAGAPFVSFSSIDESTSEKHIATQLNGQVHLGRLGILNDFHLPSPGTEQKPIEHPVDELLLSLSFKRNRENAIDTSWDAAAIQIANDFIKALDFYNEPTFIKAFKDRAAIILSTQDDQSRENALLEIQKLPGGQAFIKSAGNGPLIDFIIQSTKAREQILLRSTLSKQVANRFSALNFAAFADQEIHRGVSSDLLEPKDRNRSYQESLRQLLRYWELTSTRYLLSHSGSSFFSNEVQSYFRFNGLPVYQNLLNKELDPIERRFHAHSHYNLAASNSLEDSKLEIQPSLETQQSDICLMEFSGALPRAKLFADWQSETSPDSLSSILFSPGFNPHQRVVLATEDIPSPEQPSQTLNLPEPVFTKDSPSHISLKIAPTDYAAILLLNDQFHPDWRATVNGKPTLIHRANGMGRGVFLAASDQPRKIDFLYRNRSFISKPSTILIIGCLIVGLYGLWITRKPAISSDLMDAEA